MRWLLLSKHSAQTCFFPSIYLPSHTSQFVPAIAAGQPVLALASLKFYNVADRGGRTFSTLRELYAMNDQTCFLATQRVDGKLVLGEAVQILKMADANG